jgi:hypothetical protein
MKKKKNSEINQYPTPHELQCYESERMRAIQSFPNLSTIIL